MAKVILLLGSTGKMGLALQTVFGAGYTVVGKNSADFDALDPQQVRSLVEEHKPDIVMNTAAYLGIDACEREPDKAYSLNTLYPKYLAELSCEKGFLLVHFSTDAVFDGKKRDFYGESDGPNPINRYGQTKHSGDCFVQAIAKRYYLIRTSLLFGPSVKNSQFVEKMLVKIQQGAKSLQISDDIILSPTYSTDVAHEINRLLLTSAPSGLYHIVNQGKASLYDLMTEIVENLRLDVILERAAHADFPSMGRKNTFTPLISEKISPLRPWKQTVAVYCEQYRGSHAR